MALTAQIGILLHLTLDCSKSRPAELIQRLILPWREACADYVAG